jgi:hypothetical protein
MSASKYIADALLDCANCEHQKIQHSKKAGWPCMVGSVVGYPCHCSGFEKK